MDTSFFSFLAEPWLVIPWYAVGFLGAAWDLLGFIDLGGTPVTVHMRRLPLRQKEGCRPNDGLSSHLSTETGADRRRDEGAGHGRMSIARPLPENDERARLSETLEGNVADIASARKYPCNELLEAKP